MKPQPQTDLTAARTALELGDLDNARRLLHLVLRSDPTNYKAWLWLSGITDSAEKSLDFALRAQALAPDDPAVGQAVQWAKQRYRQETASEPKIITHTAPVRLRAKDPQEPRRNPNVRAQPPVQQAEPANKDWVGWMIGTILAVGVLVLLAVYLINQRSAAAYGMEPLALAAMAIPTATPQASVLRPIIVQRVQRPTSTPQPQPTATAMPTAVPTATPQPISIGSADQFTISAETWQQLSTSNQSAAALYTEPRWIDIDLSNQTLTAFQDGEIVLTTLISSGAYGSATITGEYRIYARTPSQTMSGYHLGYDYNTPNVPHVQYFYGDFGIHGAYWHDNFGTPVSHGCVNLDEPDAAWLYNWSDIGTLVNVHY